MTAGDPNIPVLSNANDEENMNNEVETDDESVASNLNEANTNSKLIPAMRHLETSYNPKAKIVIEEAIEKANYFEAGVTSYVRPCNQFLL